jgi:hypothetical protein
MELLTERHADEIAGVLSCYDRLLIQGTLPGLCYAQGMTAYLKARPIRIFDYAQFAQPLRDALRENAQRLAAEHGLEIMFLRKKNFRKEDRVKEILDKRRESPRLGVHLLGHGTLCHLPNLARQEKWEDLLAA